MSGNDFYARAVANSAGHLDITEGGSGYFSKPSSSLDPSLFEGTNLRGEVRDWILSTLYTFWGRKFEQAESWSQTWLAGSGISYQWAADRSNGDLDVLIGVDFPRFFQANPSYHGLSEDEVANLFNRSFRNELWPKTAQTKIGHQVYEVTFYVNPHATDIRDINPYAAYNLTTNQWTVEPPEVSNEPEKAFPKSYWDAVHTERKYASNLIDQYNGLSNELSGYSTSSPGWRSAVAKMGLVMEQAAALFDDIHLGRKQAFAPGGRGYGDFYNFRWQAHKRFGTVQALGELTRASRDVRDATQQAVHGFVIKDHEQALTQAALWNTPYRDQA